MVILKRWLFWWGSGLPTLIFILLFALLNVRFSTCAFESFGSVDLFLADSELIVSLLLLLQYLLGI